MFDPNWFLQQDVTNTSLFWISSLLKSLIFKSRLINISKIAFTFCTFRKSHRYNINVILFFILVRAESVRTSSTYFKNNIFKLRIYDVFNLSCLIHNISYLRIRSLTFFYIDTSFFLFFSHTINYYSCR